jgi:site-specific DNA recombinase
MEHRPVILRAAAYIRVSTPQQLDKYSPASQLEECLAYAAQNGYVVVGDQFVDPNTAHLVDPRSVPNALRAYVDGYTGTEWDRPALDAAYSYAKQYGFDILIVYIMDRFVRGGPGMRQFIEDRFGELGITVKYVIGNYDESPLGEMRKDMDAIFARYEKDMIRERTMRGTRKKAKQGLMPNGNPTYGYDLAPNNPASLGGLVPNGNAAIVRMMYEFIDQSGSIRQLALHMTELGIPTPYGKSSTWRMSTINNILRNPAYRGEAIWGKRAWKGQKFELRNPDEWFTILIPPIIDDVLWYRVQQQLTLNCSFLRRKPHEQYLLRGLIACKLCGSNYAGSSCPRKRKHGVVRERHYKHRRDSNCAGRTQVSTEKVDKEVWYGITMFLRDSDARTQSVLDAVALAEREAESIESQRGTLVRVRERLVHQQANLVEMQSDPEISGRLPKEQFIEKLDQINTELEVIENRVEELDLALSSLPSVQELDDLEAISEQIGPDSWEEWTFEEKRELLRRLQIRILIDVDHSLQIEGLYRAPSKDGLLTTARYPCDSQAAQPGSSRVEFLPAQDRTSD